MGLFIDSLKKGKVISICVDGDYCKEIEYKDGKIICTSFGANDLPFEIDNGRELVTEFDIVSEISDNYWKFLDTNDFI